LDDTLNAVLCASVLRILGPTTPPVYKISFHDPPVFRPGYTTTQFSNQNDDPAYSHSVASFNAILNANSF